MPLWKNYLELRARGKQQARVCSDFPFSSRKQDYNSHVNDVLPTPGRKNSLITRDREERLREICTNRFVRMTPTILESPRLFRFLFCNHPLYSTWFMGIKVSLLPWVFIFLWGLHVNVNICMLFSCSSALYQER